MKKETTAEYPVLDVMKFLAAIWFILIHCNIASLFDNELFRYSVFLIRDIGLAAFFASHGFFTMYSIDKLERDCQPEAFRKKWFSYAKTYLIWSMIYLPISVYGEFIVYQEGLVRGIGKLIWDFFVTGVHYYTWMFWYFPAMLWSLLLLYFLIRTPVRRSPRAIVLLGAVLYGIGIFVGHSAQTEWGQIYYRFFYSTQNAPFFGFLFIAWGMYSADRTADRQKAAVVPLHKKGILSEAHPMLSAAGAAACAVSGLVLYGTVWSEILRPICCIFAFEWMVRVRRTSCGDGERRTPIVFAGVLRRMSRNLFLVHMLFVLLFLQILRRDCRQPDLISTIGVLLCSLAAAGLLEWRRTR